jgi:hypothetical protein
VSSDAPQIGIPEGSNPGPAALLAANPDLGSRDMRDLLMEFGTDGITATELTQDRREAEWRASGQR